MGFVGSPLDDWPPLELPPDDDPPEDEPLVPELPLPPGPAVPPRLPSSLHAARAASARIRVPIFFMRSVSLTPVTRVRASLQRVRDTHPCGRPDVVSIRQEATVLALSEP